MKSTCTLSITRGPDPRVHLLLTTIVALYAAFIVYPVFAQEDAPAGGVVPRAGGGPGEGAAMRGPGEGAAMTNLGIDPVTPQRGSAGLLRRANVKALIANAPHQAGGVPAANTRIAPLPMHPAIAAAVPRNTIGIAMPGLRSPGQGVAGVTGQAGTRLTGLGTAAGNVGSERRQMPVPTSAGPALHGAGLNGTTMGRMATATGPGSVGGPAKDRSGINGTLMRPKH